MAFTPISYTTGNWSVSQKTVDTTTTTCPNATKSITISNMNWKTDFSTKSETPAETQVINITSDSLSAPAVCRLAYKDIKDIYASTALNPSKLALKTGVQIMVSLEELYKATNSETGEEGDIPVTGWLCLRMPTHPCCTTTLLKGAMQRILGALYATDDSTNQTLLQHLIRQKLNPTE